MVPVTIDNANPLTNFNLGMQNPNLFVKVVLPGTSTAAQNVYVNAWYNGQNFWGVTGADGIFSAYVDTVTLGASCTGACGLVLNPYGSSEYTYAQYSLNTIGNLGSRALGQITAKVTLYVPTDGVKGIPDKWAWVSVDDINESGTVSSMGYNTNELGQAGLGLVNGHHYVLTAYPSGDYFDRYSPKVLNIPSFSATDSATISITYDSPNVTFVVRDPAGGGNSWGWYEVNTVTGGSSQNFVSGYLNEQGRGAQYLPDGTYDILFHPGKSIGVDQSIQVTISGGHVSAATNASVSNDVVGVVLAAGNVRGTVHASDGTPVSNAPITAKTTSGESITVTGVSGQDGTFQISLDTTKNWIINSIDPVTVAKASLSLPANSASYTGLILNLS
jgi:hypothetical protein